MPETRIHDGELISPVETLERYFGNGGTTILRAAFEHSYWESTAPPSPTLQHRGWGDDPTPEVGTFRSQLTVGPLAPMIPGPKTNGPRPAVRSQ